MKVRGRLRPETVALLKEAELQAHVIRDVKKKPKQSTDEARGLASTKQDAVLKHMLGTLLRMYDQLDSEAVMNFATCSLTGRALIEEVRENIGLRLMRPFVEGEPIGACNNQPPPRQVTDEELVQIHNRWREQDQKALLELRAKNDATLDRMEARLDHVRRA